MPETLVDIRDHPDEAVSMDPLSEFLQATRAREAFLLRVTMTAPWSIAVQDGSPLTVLAMVSGRGRITVPGTDPVSMGTGDVAVISTTEHYVVADPATRVPTVIIGPDGRCSGPGGRDLSGDYSNLRTWGNDPDGADVLLVGSYPATGVGTNVLRTALPAVALVHSADDPLVALLRNEIDRGDVAQSVVLDRILDLLLVSTVRRWHTNVAAAEPTWLNARRDPMVRKAVEAMHAAVARPWTVDSLAAVAGSSRTTLARRFTEVVGSPPMTYLTRWRLALAADLLSDTSMTLSAIAHRVGYQSPFALSFAFKREFGISPKDHRAGTAQPNTTSPSRSTSPGSADVGKKITSSVPASS